MFADAADRTGLTIAMTGRSVAEAPEWSGIDDDAWRADRGSSNADDRNVSQVPGLFHYNNGTDAQLVVAVDAPGAEHTARHEMSHAIDWELGRRLTGDDGQFSAQDEFTAFYMRMLKAYDGTAFIQNPDFENKSLLRPYFLHRASGETHHNGMFGRSEFFAEAYALSMEADARIRGGEDRDAVLLELGGSLSVISPDNVGGTGDLLRGAGEQILDYFTDLDARAERGEIGPSADSRRTITTGRRDATTKIVKNDLSNPDATDASLLDGEEKSALSRALKVAYGIEPKQLVRNIVEAFGMSTRREREFGARWYGDAFDLARDLRDRFRPDGMNLEKAAAMIAALSPQTRWGLNKLQAERLMAVLSENPELDDEILGRTLQFADKKPGTIRTMGLEQALKNNRDRGAGSGVLDEFGSGKRLLDLSNAQIRELGGLLMRDERLGDFQYDNPDSEGRSVGKVYNGSAPAKGNFDNALAIWRAEEGDLQAISSALGGHKVRSFYNNIIHDPASGERDTSITIDTHALDTAILGVLAARLGLKAAPKPTKRALALMKKYGLEFPEGGWLDAEAFLRLTAMDGVRFTDPDKARHGTYAMFHEAFRRATEEINAQLGTDYTPKQVQAIVWLTALDDAVGIDEDHIDDYVRRWNSGMENIKPRAEIDMEDFKKRTDSKSLPGEPFEPVTADQVWLAPTDTDSPDPLEKGKKATPAPKAAWNDLADLPAATVQHATTYEGRDLIPMPEPGTPDFEALAARIREAHPNIALPTGRHRAAFLHPDWESRDASLIWRGVGNGGAKAQGYSPRYEKRQAFKRFARVRAIAEKTPEVRSELARRAEAGDDVALAALLIMDTGIRVGSGTGGTGKATVTDPKTKQRKSVTTYAATSLQPRHIAKHRTGEHYLRFIGKGGKLNTYDVTDPLLKRKLSEWYTGGTGTGRLFGPRVNSSRTAALFTDLFGFEVGNHDLRRQYATALARRLIAETARPPKTADGFKKARDRIATKVSEALNNEKDVALAHYIDWGVWADWEEGAGLRPTLVIDDSEIPGWDDVDNIELLPVEGADSVVPGAGPGPVTADGAPDDVAAPGLDIEGPAFEEFLEYYRDNYQTVEDPDIGDPEPDDPEDR